MSRVGPSACSRRKQRSTEKSLMGSGVFSQIEPSVMNQPLVMWLRECSARIRERAP